MRPGLLLIAASLVFLGFAVYLLVRLGKLKSSYATSAASQLTEIDAKERLILSLSDRIDRDEQKSLAIWQEMESILGIDYHYCTYLKAKTTTGEYSNIEIAFKSYISELLGHVAAIFFLYTRKECATSIKVFCKSNTNKIHLDVDSDPECDSAQFVFTFARDERSRYIRNQSYTDKSEIYEYADNTAFYAIKHIKDRRGYYFGNQLSSLPAGEYNNTNPKWKELYNAVAVAALKSPDRDAVYQSLGYICVDSMNGQFDDSICREILECIASIVYYTLRTTTSVLRSEEALNGLRRDPAEG